MEVVQWELAGCQCWLWDGLVMANLVVDPLGELPSVEEGSRMVVGVHQEGAVQVEVVQVVVVQVEVAPAEVAQAEVAQVEVVGLRALRVGVLPMTEDVVVVAAVAVQRYWIQT